MRAWSARRIQQNYFRQAQTALLRLQRSNLRPHMGNELRILPHLKPFSLKTTGRITRESEDCAASAATEFIRGKSINMASNRKSLDEFLGFSDQVYRHRRNLLSVSVVTISCIASESTISKLPFNIAQGKGVPLDFLLLASCIYFFAILIVSANSEYKLSFSASPIRGNTFEINDESKFPIERARKADDLIRGIKNDSAVSKEHLHKIIENLTFYRDYQRSLCRWRNSRLFFDLWVPLLLGFAAITSLSYQVYHQHYIFIPH